MNKVSCRLAWLEIDLKAIERNIFLMRSLVGPDTLVMAVVKADGYGHGAVQVAASALRAGAQRLGVALLDEALELRQAGVGVPIQVLSEIPPEGAEEAVEQHIICTVYSAEAAEALSNAAIRQGRNAKVHMKVDTGMHRIGVRPAFFKGLLRQVAAMPGIDIEGCFTHFALADEPSDPFTEQQLDLFLRLREEHRVEIPIWHAANSAAAFFFPDSRLDMVRIGIAMYGLQPSATRSAPVELLPALSLRARLSYVQDIQTGQGVSYGLTFRAGQNTRIGTVPLGYGDGYSRLLSNKASVLIMGRRYPLVGNICMDQLMVDLDGSACEPGETVTLVGADGQESISLEELADIVGTINYEMACMLGARLPRHYLKGSLGYLSKKKI